MIRTFLDYWSEASSIERGIIIAVVATGVLLLGVLYQQAKEKQRDGCHRTGAQRIAYIQQVGTTLMPIYEHEYFCDETRDYRWY